MDSVSLQLFIISAVVIIVVVLLIEPLRNILVWFIKDIFIPAVGWLFNFSLLYVAKMFKDVVASHWILIKNLYTTRAVIFPTLEDQRHDRDKAMNRKKK